MTIIGTAEVAVHPDTSSFADDLKSKIGSALQNPMVVAGAAVAAVGTVVGAFAKSSVDKFQEVGGEVKSLTTVTGGSAESMSRLRFAADTVGVSTDTLGAGLKKLSVDITSHNSKLNDAGIAYTDTKGKVLPLDQTLANVAQKFAAMPNGVAKNTLAIQLFGKSGTDLIPILNKGKDGLAQLSAQSDKYGLTLTGSNLDAIKKNAIAHKDLQDAMEGVKVQVGAALMPVLANFAEFIDSKAIPVLTTITGTVREDLGPAVNTLAGFVSDAATAFSTGFSDSSSLGSNLTTIGGFFTTLGSGVKGVFDAAVTDYGEFIKGFSNTDPSQNLKAVGDIFTTFGAQLKGIWTDLNIAWGSFVDGFSSNDAVSAEVGPLATAFAAVGVVVRDSLGALKDIAQFFIDHPKIFEAATGAVLGFKGAYEGIQFGKKTINFVANGLDAAKGAVDDIVSGFAKIGDKVISVAVKSTAEQAAQGAASGAGSSAGSAAGNVAQNVVGGAAANALDVKSLSSKIGAFAKGFAETLGIALLYAIDGIGTVVSGALGILFSGPVLIGIAVVAAGVLIYAFRDNIINFLTSTLPDAFMTGLSALGSLAGFLVSKGAELIEGLFNGVGNAILNLPTYLMDLLEIQVTALGFLAGLLVRGGNDLISGLFNGIQTIWDASIHFFSDIPGAVLGLLGDLSRLLYSVGSALLQGLWDGITFIWNGNVHFWTDIVPSVLSFLGDLASTLYQKGLDLLQGLFRGSIDVWNSSGGFFRAIPGAVLGFIGDVARTLYSKGEDLIHGIHDGIFAAWDAVSSFFSGLGGSIVRAIGDASRWLYNIGSEIVNGLIAGIGDIGKFASKLAGDFLKGFKSALGIKSPSTEMHSAGLQMLQGLANGISAGKQLATDAMGDVVNSLTDPFGSGALPALAGASAGGSGKYTHIESLTIQNTKTLQENLDEIDRLTPLVPA